MNKKVCIVVASLLALGMVTARGQEIPTDLGSWENIQLIKPVGKAYAMGRLEHRSYNHISATECWFAMAGGGYNFNNWLKGDLSYEFWRIPAAGDVTTHKAVASIQATYKPGDFALILKEKYEEAFTDGNASGTLRTRLKAQYTPQGSFATPYLIYEYFNGFSGKIWQRSLHYAGCEFKVGSRTTIDCYYLYHLYPTATGKASCHILGLGLTFIL